MTLRLNTVLSRAVAAGALGATPVLRIGAAGRPPKSIVVEVENIP